MRPLNRIDTVQLHKTQALDQRQKLLIAQGSSRIVAQSVTHKEQSAGVPVRQARETGNIGLWQGTLVHIAQDNAEMDELANPWQTE